MVSNSLDAYNLKWSDNYTRAFTEFRKTHNDGVYDAYTPFVPMCIYHIFQITYDVYGLIEWIKLEKRQEASRNGGK